MKRVLKLGFAVLAAVVFGRATCGKSKPAGVTPVQKVKFTDHVRYHNMGIAWDGDYYYTVNGGNTDYSDLNLYDESGSLEDSYDFGTDGRAILYSPDEEQLYLKEYGTDLSWVDLDFEEAGLEHEDVFRGDQSHVAMSPDGEKLYELYEGTVYVYDAITGDEETSFELPSYNTTGERGYANAIAASGKFLFVWAPDSDTDILVYGIDGKYVTKFTLPRSGFGFSLSWANGMLWIAEDADGDSDGADGTWYGYALEGLE
ncbi:hypothetical protein JXD38_10920 [candidate division WOR-3 bacterium]|nr:hypothetical protein [candidate division WOR-3 bacterium]